jgi:hypothetical protein
MSSTLGLLAIYTVSTGGEKTLDVTRDQLEGWFAELGLNTQFLPSSAKAVDNFRAAASTSHTREYVGADGKRYRLVIEEKKSDPDLIVRWVMRQGLSEGGQTLRVADITYARGRRRTSGRVKGSEDVWARLHAGLRGAERVQIQGFVDECLSRYGQLSRQLTPQRVRALLRDYLNSIDAVQLAPLAGTYFIPREHMDAARRLGVFVDRCGEGCRMLVAPVVDTPEQRDMVAAAVDADVDGRARKTLEDIAAWQAVNPRKTPSSQLTDSWVSEFRGLQEMLLRYTKEYDIAFPQAADSLEELRIATRTISRRYATSLLELEG